MEVFAMHKWDEKDLGANFRCKLEPWREKRMYMSPVTLENGKRSLAPNGCDDYSPCPECKDCLEESLLDFQEWLKDIASGTPGKGPSPHYPDV